MRLHQRGAEAGHEGLAVGATAPDDGVAGPRSSSAPITNPTAPHDAPLSSTVIARTSGAPGAFGLHRDDLVEVERQHQRGRLATQLARRQRARDRLVRHEQHPVAASEIHHAGIITVRGTTGVVGRHAGLRRHRPPLRVRLPGARLRAAVRDDPAQRGTESAVRRLVEERERRAVRGAVGRQLGIHVGRERSSVVAHRTRAARP